MWQVGDEPVPGYRLESFLGKGSNAKVWRVSGPGRTSAALKVISLSGKLGLKEFRGIQRVKEIRHAHLLPITAFWILDQQGAVLDDHVIQTLDAKAHGRRLHITETMNVEPQWPKTLIVAMLLGERNLLEQLQQHQKAGSQGIPVKTLLDYMEDAAKGIDFLNSPRHDLGSGPVAIQHCDIKPQNLVLVGDSVMVCDFGLARVLGATDSYRTITGPAGTPAYVAPECIRGAVPSCATDQYSLAITYCELRTGRLPFAGEALTDIYEAHTTGKLELGRLPPGESQVIRRATLLKPEERYPSTLQMVRALRDAVEEQGPSGSAVEAFPATRSADPRSIRSADPRSIRSADPRHSPPSVPRDPADAMNSPSPEPGHSQSQTFVLHFKPKNARVTINDTCRELDTEGRLEIQGNLGTMLSILAALEGYEDFQETLAVAQLEWCSYVIELQRDVYYLVEQGMLKLKQGDIEGAVADFDEAIQRDPDLAEAYHGRTLAYGATAEHRRNCADAYNELAHAHFAKGDYHRAAIDFTEAFQLAPDLAEVNDCRLLRNRAVAYRNQGLFDQAIADYNEAIRRCPRFAKAFRDRAMTYCEMGDYDRAIRDCAEALRLTPEGESPEYRQDYASVCRARGDARYKKGDHNKALADYNEAIRVRPDWGIVLNQRGRSHGAMGDYEKAIADYSQSIELDPDFAHLYFYNRGSAYYRKGDYTNAIADFSAAIERKQNYRKAYRYRSWAYEKLGMQPEAEADMAKAKTFESNRSP